MRAFMALQLSSDPEQCAVDDGAIIIGQLDETRLNDQTAEFNQMSGSLASLNLPSAHIIASPCRLTAIVCCPVALQRCDGCAEMPEQFAGACFRKTSLHA